MYISIYSHQNLENTKPMPTYLFSANTIFSTTSQITNQFLHVQHHLSFLCPLNNFRLQAATARKQGGLEGQANQQEKQSEKPSTPHLGNLARGPPGAVLMRSHVEVPSLLSGARKLWRVGSWNWGVFLNSHESAWGKQRIETGQHIKHVCRQQLVTCVDENEKTCLRACLGMIKGADDTPPKVSTHQNIENKNEKKT